MSYSVSLGSVSVTKSITSPWYTLAFLAAASAASFPVTIPVSLISFTLHLRDFFWKQYSFYECFYECFKFFLVFHWWENSISPIVANTHIRLRGFHRQNLCRRFPQRALRPLLKWWSLQAVLSLVVGLALVQAFHVLFHPIAVLLHRKPHFLSPVAAVICEQDHVRIIQGFCVQGWS